MTAPKPKRRDFEESIGTESADGPVRPRISTCCCAPVRALQGQFDPQFTRSTWRRPPDALWRGVFHANHLDDDDRRQRARGIEACLNHRCTPGDKVMVPISGASICWSRARARRTRRTWCRSRRDGDRCLGPDGSKSDQSAQAEVGAIAGRHLDRFCQPLRRSAPAKQYDRCGMYDGKPRPLAGNASRPMPGRSMTASSGSRRLLGPGASRHHLQARGEESFKNRKASGAGGSARRQRRGKRGRSSSKILSTWRCGLWDPAAQTIQPRAASMAVCGRANARAWTERGPGSRPRTASRDVGGAEGVWRRGARAVRRCGASEANVTGVAIRRR